MSPEAFLTPLILLLLGGVITLIVTLAVNRITTREPRLAWRLLPPISFPSEGLTAFTVTVANDGTADAEHVRLVMDYPADVSIQSLDIKPSEAAMTYEILDTKISNQLGIMFTNFGKGLECIFTFLARGLDPDRLSISILGKNVVGRQRPAEPRNFAPRLVRIAVIALSGAVALFTLVIIYVSIIGLASMNYSQELEIASFYESAGRDDKAIAKYENMIVHAWFPTTFTLQIESPRRTLGITM